MTNISEALQTLRNAPAKELVNFYMEIEPRVLPYLKEHQASEDLSGWTIESHKDLDAALPPLSKEEAEYYESLS